MLDVLFVCRSEKKARERAAGVLDKFFYRIGDRTWRGRASMEALRRVSAELKACASRNMAVAAYRSGPKEAHMRPMFVIGSKSKFSAEGRSPVAVRRRSASSNASPYETTLKAIVECAALFHDVGKAGVMFQKKVRSNAGPQADAVRHELISALVLAQLIDVENSSAENLAERLREIAADPTMITQAWRLAADFAYEALMSRSADYEVFTAKTLPDATSLRSVLILTVLSHHRLAEIHYISGRVAGGEYLDQSAGTLAKTVRADLDIAEGRPFWTEEWFAARLTVVADMLEAGGVDRLPRGMDLYSRFPMMLADHIGSSQKQAGIGEGHIANTLDAVGGAPREMADSLFRHVQRVCSNTRTMTIGNLRSKWQFPSIDEDEVEDFISNPQLQGGRFDWQAMLGAELRERAKGCAEGMFVAVTAGTGSGKTRGAAIAMAAMAFGSEGERSGLRYNLCLPLRTLTRQSGREYVEDLGFRASDVATFVGGEAVKWIDDEEELTGSEDRLLSLAGAEIETFENEALDVLNLGFNPARTLPAHGALLAEDKLSGKKAKKLLEVPIVVATIDQLMDAASPLRGRHISEMLRVTTSDLVIDEIDNFSEEDLSAVGRLVRIAGLAGRRVLIMSATLPKDILQAQYDIYERAYSVYAEVHGVPDAVEFVCAADVNGSIFTRGNSASMLEAYEQCLAVTMQELRSKPGIHKGSILSKANSWSEQVEIISKGCDDLHCANHFEHEGKEISVGLVRLTRIKHVQALAMQLDASSDKSVHREILVLHSAMPRVQREGIERLLRESLTRKGTSPNEKLVRSLDKLGYFERARAAGACRLQVIVLASPVIETGNDVDFDWLITDPSSVRSIVQAAGRVNRHRRTPATGVNIGILGEYLVAAETGTMSSPGVETEPARETGVKQLTIDGSRLSRDLIAEVDTFAVDAGMVTTSAGRLAALEEELRKRYAQAWTKDQESHHYEWSARVGRKHRFRRSTGAEFEIYPQIEGNNLEWRFFPSRKSRVSTDFKVQNINVEKKLRSLVSTDLESLVTEVQGYRIGKILKFSPLQLRQNEATVTLDNDLGVIRGLDKLKSVRFVSE